MDGLGQAMCVLMIGIILVPIHIQIVVVIIKRGMAMRTGLLLGQYPPHFMDLGQPS